MERCLGARENTDALIFKKKLLHTSSKITPLCSHSEQLTYPGARSRHSLQSKLGSTRTQKTHKGHLCIGHFRQYVGGG